MPDQSPISVLLTGRGRWWAHTIAWTVFALMFFFMVNELRGWQEALIRTSVNFTLLIGLFYFNARVLVDRFLENGRWVTYMVAAAITILTLAAIRAYSASILPGGLFPQQTPERTFGVTLLLYLLVLLLSGMYQLLENRLHAELQAHAWEARHAEAQLSYLKARINPHFLFNTLHNIYAAANLQLPQTADMVLQLSQLLRYVTYEAQAPALPLDTEWAHLERYLDLYRMRAEDNLNLHLSRSHEGETWYIAPMLLLPLVENALKHGNLEFDDQAFVTISLETSPKALHFQVHNSFDQADQQRDSVGGVGLENIRQRLELLYPGTHAFTALARENVFIAELTLTQNLIFDHENATLLVG
jgi:sensor histidine kinase YesM